MKKGILMKMSSWSQLFFLALFIFGGLVLLILVMTVAGGGSIERMQSMDFLRVMQLVQAVFLFLVPACLCAYLFHEAPLSYLKINKAIDIKFLLLSLLLIIIIQPFISLSGYYNNMITLPDSLAGIEKVLRDMEESASILMEKMLTTNSISTLVFNIFIIAIMAGITEEFLFRGSLQQIIKKLCHNKHVAIWITAIIFSAIHFQFYGFFPRLFLGAILGYIFFWSGNLWIAVIAHAFNNLLSILIFHFYYGTPEYEQAEKIGSTPDTMWIAGVSLVLSITILYFLSKDGYKTDRDELAF